MFHQTNVLRCWIDALPVLDRALEHVGKLGLVAEEVRPNEVHHAPVLHQVVLQKVKLLKNTYIPSSLSFSCAILSNIPFDPDMLGTCSGYPVRTIRRLVRICLSAWEMEAWEFLMRWPSSQMTRSGPGLTSALWISGKHEILYKIIPTYRNIGFIRRVRYSGNRSQ